MIKVSNLEFKAIVTSALDGTLGVNKNENGDIIFHTQNKLTGNLTERINVMSDDRLAVIVFDKGKVKSVTVTDINLWRV